MMLNIRVFASENGLHLGQTVQDIVDVGACVEDVSGEKWCDEDVLKSMDFSANKLVDMTTIARTVGMDYNKVRRMVSDDASLVRYGFIPGKSKLYYRIGDAVNLLPSPDTCEMVDIKVYVEEYGVNQEFLEKDLSKLNAKIANKDGKLLVEKAVADQLMDRWLDEYIGSKRFAVEMGVKYSVIKNLMRRKDVSGVRSLNGGARKIWRRGDLMQWYGDSQKSVVDDGYASFSKLSHLLGVYYLRLTAVKEMFWPEGGIDFVLQNGKVLYHKESFLAWAREAIKRYNEFKELYVDFTRFSSLLEVETSRIDFLRSLYPLRDPVMRVRGVHLWLRSDVVEWYKYATQEHKLDVSSYITLEELALVMRVDYEQLKYVFTNDAYFGDVPSKVVDGVKMWNRGKFKNWAYDALSSAGFYITVQMACSRIGCGIVQDDVPDSIPSISRQSAKRWKVEELESWVRQVVSK